MRVGDGVRSCQAIVKAVRKRRIAIAKNYGTSIVGEIFVLRLNTMKTDPRTGSQAAFTLVEVMLGMTILVMLSLGLTAAVLFSVKSATYNVMKNTAYTTAQGYLEQIKSLPAPALAAAVSNPSSIPLPTKSISSLQVSGPVVETTDPLYLIDTSAGGGHPNHKQILVDMRKENGVDKKIVMDMWFQVGVTPINAGRGYFIEMTFWFDYPAIRFLKPKPGVLGIVRSVDSNQ